MNFGNLEHKIVAGKYELLKRLGAGSFGEVYLAVNKKTGVQVAIKLEKSNIRFPQLSAEAKLYKYLAGGYGIPKLHTYVTDGDFNVLAIQLLGKSLEDFFAMCNRKFSLKTVLQLADQFITRVEYLHKQCFLHRDIKPDNFMMGIGDQSHVVYMIDMGLAKKYKSSTTNTHIDFKDGKGLTGTARYCSIRTHLGIEQSRRDDLEAIGYMLIYLLKGALPWQNLGLKDADAKHKKISELKQSVKPEKLCDGCGHEFVSFLNHARNLEFTEEPDYDYCRNLFRTRFEKEGFVQDNVYDWFNKMKKEEPVDDVSSPRVVHRHGSRSGKKNRADELFDSPRANKRTPRH